ncbi:MAG TPA: EF-hand domain-containing protein [Rudaea sp.]|nr:EF-hand domain-containing protein [Rudaea sp.]
MAKSPTQSQSTRQSAATAPAPSNDAQSTAQVKFEALDANHDGYIDRQEAAVSKPLANEFATIDANKDGKLSLIEFEAIKDLASIKTSSDGYQKK